MGKACETPCNGGGRSLPQNHQVPMSGIRKNKYNFRPGIVTSAMPCMQNTFIRTGLLNLPCGVSNLKNMVCKWATCSSIHTMKTA